MTLDGFELQPDELLVTMTGKPGYAVAEEAGYAVAVTTEITPELADEGLARELVRRIQEMRKSAGFEIADRIRLSYDGDADVARVIDTWRDYITQETLADSIAEGAAAGHTEDHDIDGRKVTLTVAKALARLFMTHARRGGSRTAPTTPHPPQNASPGDQMIPSPGERVRACPESTEGVSGRPASLHVALNSHDDLLSPGERVRACPESTEGVRGQITARLRPPDLARPPKQRGAPKTRAPLRRSATARLTPADGARSGWRLP